MPGNNNKLKNKNSRQNIQKKIQGGDLAVPAFL